MSLQNINSIRQISFQAKPPKNTAISNFSQKSIINGENKLKRTLMALGAIAAAGVGIGILIHKHNTKGSQNLAQKAADTLADAANNKIESAIPDKLTEAIPGKLVQQTSEEVTEIQEKLSDLDKKIQLATKEYQKRLTDGTDFSQRVKNIKKASAKKTNPITSLVRKTALEKNLGKEQLAALNDETLAQILTMRDYSSIKLQNMDFVKTLSPEQLIKIQANPEKTNALYRVILEPNLEPYFLKSFTNILSK